MLVSTPALRDVKFKPEAKPRIFDPGFYIRRTMSAAEKRRSLKRQGTAREKTPRWASFEREKKS
jgi:hypothetical protein